MITWLWLIGIPVVLFTAGLVPLLRRAPFALIHWSRNWTAREPLRVISIRVPAATSTPITAKRKELTKG